ncbi:hypothetical protein HG15A2_45840 [Adhaeretor mobilis]|uniref:Ice-binding protein C-terminal domain-containing protein n=2 Tax=Adhaeretor mobilis TaxID=1930276 RepID=A0A517N280_9BACT|nr:hypothetical protein HG15A2_45840 [Adhaeretor mobilis]
MNYKQSLVSVPVLYFLLTASLGSPAQAQLITTRQVSTGDISPTLYAQVNNGGPFEPPAGVVFRNVQLFTPAVDGTTLAFISSSFEANFFNPVAYFEAGLFLIDGLTPQLHSDGTTNLNVKPIVHGVTDPGVGAFANGPSSGGAAVGFDFAPNSISLSNGSVSVFTLQNGPGNRYGLYEGTTTTVTTAPVPSVEVIADQNHTVLAGAEVAVAGTSANGHHDSFSFARDGDRTVAAVLLTNDRWVLTSYENGVRENLLISGGGAEAIDLPDGPFLNTKYVDADGGQIALISSDKVYKFDTANNASLLVDAGGPLNYLTLDGDDVVVGRGGPTSGGFNPVVTTRGRGGSIRPDLHFLGAAVGSIAQVQDSALVDLVDSSTPIPGTAETFAAFGPYSYSEGNLAFVGSGPSASGIGGLFVQYLGEVFEVLSIGDTFDGKMVTGVDINRRGLDGDLLAFVVSFESIDLPNNDIMYDQSIYTLSLSENFAAAGDFDIDGDVDGADFLEWQRIDGTPTGLSEWQTNYGTPPGPLSLLTAVPEPSGTMLLGLSAFGILCRSKRQPLEQ